MPTGKATHFELPADTYERKAGARHARKPLVALDQRGESLLEFIAYGVTDPAIAKKFGVEVGKPLSVEDAGRCAGLRARNARFVVSQRVFRARLAEELENIRNGAKVGAMLKTIELVHEPGEGTAADRKVQLQAAGAVLAAAIGQPPAKNEVNVNVGMQLTAGVVIRLPPGVQSPPLERQQIIGGEYPREAER